jgi:small subunit ribosomal protein S21
LQSFFQDINKMIVVAIKENETLDKALKKYKKKFEKLGMIKELRARQAFEKKSVSRKNEIKRAAYRLRLQNEVV